MLTDRETYKALEAHYQQIRNTHLRTIFAEDPARAQQFAAEGAGLYLDYSKHRVTRETIARLIALAEDCGLRDRIDAMFRGDHINVTEDRAAWHTQLRAGTNPDVEAVLAQMSAFATKLRGQSKIRNIVNIGIGGSDLGPVMAYEALKDYSKRDFTFRFISNVDPTDLVEVTRDLQP